MPTAPAKSADAAARAIYLKEADFGQRGLEGLLLIGRQHDAAARKLPYADDTMHFTCRARGSFTDRRHARDIGL